MDTSLSPTDMAFALTHRSGHEKYKMAAVVTDTRGRKIAWGWNHVPETQMREYYSAHAEWHAISRAKKSRLRGATMYVVGVKQNGNVITAKPCDTCQDLCKKHGIDKIVFSTPEGFFSMQLQYV